MSNLFLENIIKHNDYKSISEYLYSLGVPQENIDIAKETKVYSREKLKYAQWDCLYADNNNEKTFEVNPKKISLDNIYATARTTEEEHNMSWYELMNETFFNINNKIDTPNYSKKRFSNIFECFHLQKEDNFNSIKEKFQSEDKNGKFNNYDFFQYEDMYFQVTDGSHRLIIAKIVGVDYVYAKSITPLVVKQDCVEEIINTNKRIESDIKALVKNSKYMFFNNENFSTIYLYTDPTHKKEIILKDISIFTNYDDLNLPATNDNFQRIYDYLTEIDDYLENIHIKTSIFKLKKKVKTNLFDAYEDILSSNENHLIGKYTTIDDDFYSFLYNYKIYFEKFINKNK